MNFWTTYKEVHLEQLYFVYILRCSDESLYCGITNNLQRRVNEHNNSNKGAKYTKNRRPTLLIYSEEHKGKSEALKREYQIKQLSKSDKNNLIKTRQDNQQQ